MNIKFRAFSYTVGIFAGASLAGLALVQILQALPPEWVPVIAMSAILLVGFNFVYTITKAHLEYKAKLEEIVNKK